MEQVDNKKRITADSFGASFDGDRFRTILNSISDGVFAVDLEWRITCFNTSAERIIGLKREQVMGKTCREVFGGDVCEGVRTLQHTMESGNPVVNLPIHMQASDGRSVPVVVTTSIIRNAVGEVLGGVETFRDIDNVKLILEKSGGSLALSKIVTTDTRVKKLLEKIPMIARSESTVLISGESGTGKGLLAEAIHDASPRKDGAMVTINCGALPENLLESELFGYKAGAFTDARKDKPGRVSAAEGGTLFLDEIGDLPLPVQVKILRLLQDKQYEPLGGLESVKADVRIIAATNRKLMEMVEKGTFREDLYYRVNVIPMVMPPLRERKSDIPLLVDSFLRNLSMARGKAVDGISHDALRMLMNYDYPGNVRELENILEHAYALCTGLRIEEGDLPEWFTEKKGLQIRAGGEGLRSLEAGYIREILARNGWNRTKAAKEMGIHVTTLHRKIRKFGIDLPAKDGRSNRGAGVQSGRWPE